MNANPLIECMDVGGTHIRYALIQSDRIIAKRVIPTPKSGIQDVLAAIETFSKEMRAQLKKEIARTCIGFPGPIVGDVLLNSAPLSLSHAIDLKEWKTIFGNQTILENDLNLAVQAERLKGFGTKSARFFLLTISTGIGAGIIWDGKRLEGSVGEFGHSTLDSSPSAPRCGCGRKGCWFTHSSGKGMEQKALQLTGKKYAAEEIFAAKNETWAQHLIEEAKNFNAIGIGNMLNAFPIEAIIIMGSVGLHQFQEIIPSPEEIAAHTINPVPPIIPTRLGDSIGIWGAYYTALAAPLVPPQRIGIVGLGKMGARIAEHLLEKGVDVIALDSKSETLLPLQKKGISTTSSYTDFAQGLGKPKMILLMVPHGAPVDEAINGLSPFLASGDILIDGGNSFFKDSQRRAKELEQKGIFFLDAGISGGLEGARSGASIMVGGNLLAFERAEPLFRALAVENGYAYMGKSGAGHFVKMVHNGIEYAMLQSIGEGFALLENSPFELDLHAVANVFRNGSVIRGWLMDLLTRALEKDPHLHAQSGIIGNNETGNWALRAANEMQVSTPLLEQSIRARTRSFTQPDLSTKVVAALRFEFGGHVSPEEEKKINKMKAQTIHCTDAGALAQKIATHLQSLVHTKNGIFSMAIPGGKDVIPILRALALLEMDWSRVHVFMADERLVPLTSLESNYKQAQELFFSHANEIHVHPFQMEKGIDAFNNEFQSVTKGKLDLVLVGMGMDGHIASLFPHHAALQSQENGFVSISNAPLQPQNRISLSPMAIQNAEHVFLYAANSPKQHAWNAFLNPAVSESDCPAKITVRASHTTIYTVF